MSLWEYHFEQGGQLLTCSECECLPEILDHLSGEYYCEVHARGELIDYEKPGLSLAERNN